MKTLIFLSTVKSDENVGIKVNSELVKKVQDYLLPNSNSINLTIQEKDNLLGVKYSILNIGNLPIEGQLGVDTELLDAILAGMCGQVEALKAYDPTDHQVERGTDLKHDLLDQFLAAALPCVVKVIPIKNDKFIEIAFQLGYLRKVRIYFPLADKRVDEKLVAAGVLVA